jgi:chitodextrinase
MFRLRSFLSLALGLVLGALSTGSVQAAPLENVSVTLTRQTIATSTDVAVAFTTPGGVNAPSDDIHIQFASGFDLTSIDFSDLELTYGPVTGLENSVTIAAMSGMGIWSAEVEPFLDGGLAIRPPIDAVLGTVPAGDRIVLKIGVWAGGVDTVITPPTTGMHQVYVGGPFGDSGSGYVLIMGISGLNVSATVPATSGGGGATGPIGGGSPAPDVGPPLYDGAGPVISALRAEMITTSSAMIRWTTDEAADAYLEYGSSAGSYTLGSRSRADRRTSHEFLLESLSPDTNYHLRVSAKDASGNTSLSSNFTFRTTAVLVASELTISGIEVLYVDDQKAVIRWSTSVDTYGEIRYGSAPSIGSAPDTVFGRSHTVTIIGLTPATFYPFQVVATAPAREPVVVDGPGFLTANDTTPPSNVLNFRGTYTTASGIVDLRWTNPPDADLKNVIITRYAADLAGGETFVCATEGERCTDVPPAGAGTVMYRAVAQDLFGNRSSGSITSVVIPAAVIVPIPEPETDGESDVTSDDGAAVLVPRPIGGGPDVEVDVVLPPILRPLPPGAGTTDGGIDGGSGGATTTVVTAVEPGASTSTTSVPTSPLLPEGADSAFELAPEFFLSSTVPATPDRSGVRSALAGRAVQIRLPIAGVTASLRQAQILASNGSIYQFAYREAQGAYVSDFTFDAAAGETQFVQIQAIATDGQAWSGRFPFRIQS